MKTPTVQFNTIAEAEDQRAELIASIQSIEIQLGETSRNHADGTRMTRAEFAQWRGRARRARAYMMAELRAVNQWIKNKNIEQNEERLRATGIDTTDPYSVLRAAYGLFSTLKNEVEMDPEELAVMDAVRKCLAERKVG